MKSLADFCWHFPLTFLCLHLCPWISYLILRYVKDTIRAPGPSGIAPMPSAGIFKRKNEKKSPREPDTTTSSSSSIGRPSGVFVHPSTGLREKFGLKPGKTKENIRISFILNRGTWCTVHRLLPPNHRSLLDKHRPLWNQLTSIFGIGLLRPYSG